MSRDSAKAHYTKQPGDPDEGFITASDAQAAIDDIYDDMSAPAVIADGSVTSGKIAADAVGSAQIATGAVGSGELATDAVTSDKIADGAVSNAHVASDAAIAASKVAGTAVTQADTGTVTNGMLAGSIAKTKVAGTAITAADTGTVTGTMIGTGEVGNGNLAANAVNAAKIASGAVTTVKIEDDAVTTAKIAADAVTSAEIAANAVGASELADNAVDTAAIAADAVTADKIANDTITAAELAANSVGTSELADDSVTAAKILDGTITANEIQNASITGVKLVNDTITATQIAANAVGASELADNAVNTAAIQDGAVTADKLAFTLPAPVGEIDGIGIPTLPAATTPTNLASAGQAFDGGSIADWSGNGGGQNNASTISAVTGPDGPAMLVECAGSAILEGCHTTLTGLTSGHTYTVALRVARVSGKNPLYLTAYANGATIQSFVTASGTTQVVMACVFVATGPTANFAVSIETAAGQASSFRIDAFGYWEGAGGNLPAYQGSTTTGMTALESGVIGLDGSHHIYGVNGYTNQPWVWRAAAGARVAIGGDDLHTAQLSGYGTIGGNHTGPDSTVLASGFTGQADAASRTWTWDDVCATQVQTWTYRADSPGVAYVDTKWTFKVADTLNFVQTQAAAPSPSPTFAIIGASQECPLVTWATVAVNRWITPADYAGGVPPACLMARGSEGSTAVIELGDRVLEGDGNAGYVSTVKNYLFSQRSTSVVNGTIVHSRAAHSWSPHTHDRALHVVRDGAVVRWFLMAGSTGSTTHPSLPLYEGAVVVQTRGTAAVTTEVVSGAIAVTGAGWAEGVIRTDIA